ncbi:hypothetical protein DCS_01286 [Drechmeria coniospora]|uniref:Uncharacterized protein n=1 Tax=Drechmeria coniospora TaxID=98403 RepID=A0A151GSV8_DRECN|nr:hypothetical protein DCS_01286 [Drechmeria coniospora]KYK60151.1 hypothetical protein DCS_01286 [Drechmeria coniospora]
MAPLDNHTASIMELVAKSRTLLSRTAESIAAPLTSDALANLRTRSLRSVTQFYTRAVNSGDNGSDSLINLLLAILGLVFLSLVLATALYFLHRRRRLNRQRMQTLPTYKEMSQKRGLTLSHTGRPSIVYIGRDGEPMLQNPRSPPHSLDNVPEIRITFPDEQDEQGRPRSGRVLVVRVGDNATVGLEPMREEPLPAYEKDSKDQFHSIDMDQIGGLKEKDRALFQ